MSGCFNLRLLRVCLSWLFITISPIAAGEDIKLSNEEISAQWIAHLRTCFKKIFSIQGDFIQEIYCGSNPVTSELRGRFKVKRKGMYRWEYAVPEGHIMVSDGKSFFTYNSTENRVVTSHSADPLLTAVSKLLTGEADDFFFVTTLGGSNEQEQFGVIQLTPKESHPTILYAAITISKSAPFLKRIIIVDRAGCLIRTTFQNAEFNKGIKNAVFRFNPPKNVVITEP
jgi:chaperone LolA